MKPVIGITAYAEPNVRWGVWDVPAAPASARRRDGRSSPTTATPSGLLKSWRSWRRMLCVPAGRSTDTSPPSRSSRVANIIGSPFFVRIRLHSAIMPPTVTQSPSFLAARSASEQSTFARSAGRTSLSGWLDRNSPSVSFSHSFSCLRSSGSGMIGGSWCAAASSVPTTIR
jgi:hypothetical protein